MKHLITLTLGGLLGVCLMAGDAEACHRNRCGGGCGGGRVACARPVAYASCGHRAQQGGGCHRRRCNTHAGPVMASNCGNAYGGYSYGGYSHGYGAPMATGQYMGSAQGTGQYMTAPQAPGKAMGVPQR